MDNCARSHNNCFKKDFVTQFEQSQIKRHRQQENQSQKVSTYKRYNEPFDQNLPSAKVKYGPKRYGFFRAFGESGLHFFREIEKEVQNEV